MTRHKAKESYIFWLRRFLAERCLLIGGLFTRRNQGGWGLWLYLLGAVCLFWLVVVWAWPPAYLTLTVDDSFYYLKTAINIAGGHGVTFDQINPTNGFHPLWMVLFVPMAWLGADDVAVLMRVALSIQVLFVLAGSITLSRSGPLSASRTQAVIAILLTNFYAAKILINGQESALQYLVLAISLSFWWKHCQLSCTPHHAVALGALAGLCTLARLDAILFSVSLLAMPLIWPPASPTEANQIWPRLRATLLGFAVLGLVTAPYFFWNWANFGHLAPVSGAIKFGRVLVPTLRGFILSAMVLAGLLLYWWFGRKNHPQERFAGLLRYMFPLSTYIALETIYLMGAKGRIMSAIWYMMPHFLLACLATSALVGYLKRLKRGYIGVSALGLACLLFAGLTWSIRLDPASYSAYTIRRQNALWIKENSPADALLAGWNAGILGAHADRRFMNLDGLINSWEYKEKYLDTGKVDKFINDVHPVDYVLEFQNMDYVHQSWDSGKAIIKGIDFSSWYVAHARFADFRSITTPNNTEPLIHLILSRQPCETCVYRFEEFVLLAADEYTRTGAIHR